MRRLDHQGFSLIELLIVVAIIMVIAAMAIPGLLQSKIQANEASAVASMRTITTAQSTYQLSYPTVGYADGLAKLGPPAVGMAPNLNKAGLLDEVLGCPAANGICSKSGYRFQITVPAGNPAPLGTYSLTAVPISVTQSGNRGFCTDPSGVTTFDPAGGTNCTQMLR